MAHARASASAAYRWVACPGSLRQAEGLPEPAESEYAAAGTLAHEAAAYALNAGHTFSIDPAVQQYVDYVWSRSKTALCVVAEVDFTPVLSKLHPDLGGTADAVLVYRDLIEVIDYKHGQGVVVEAEGNMQLRIYALGALLAVTRGGITTVRVTIVQPRAEHPDGPIRAWEFPAEDLLEFAAELTEAVERTRTSPVLAPGGHCKFCPAAATCPALEKQHRELVAQDFSVIVSPALVGQALDLLPQLEARIKAVRELAYNMAARGEPPVGYKLVEKRATRKWKDEDKAMAACDSFIKTGYIEQTLKSPTQIEAMIGKNRFAQLLADQVVKISSGHTLVHVSDKRPPASVAQLEDFSAVSGTEERKEVDPPLFSFEKE